MTEVFGRKQQTELDTVALFFHPRFSELPTPSDFLVKKVYVWDEQTVHVYVPAGPLRGQCARPHDVYVSFYFVTIPFIYWRERAGRGIVGGKKAPSQTPHREQRLMRGSIPRPQPITTPAGTESRTLSPLHCPGAPGATICSCLRDDMCCKKVGTDSGIFPHWWWRQEATSEQVARLSAA